MDSESLGRGPLRSRDARGLTAARRRLEEGWALYDREAHGSQARSFGGHDPGVCCLAFDGLALWALGYPDRALARSREAVTLARSLSHPFSTGRAELYAAMLYQLRGEAASARDHARETIALTHEQDFPQFLAYGNVVHGWARTELDGGEEGLPELRDGVRAARERGDRFLFPHCLALLAEASLHSGLLDEGLDAAMEGLGKPALRWLLLGSGAPPPARVSSFSAVEIRTGPRGVYTKLSGSPAAERPVLRAPRGFEPRAAESWKRGALDARRVTKRGTCSRRALLSPTRDREGEKSRNTLHLLTFSLAKAAPYSLYLLLRRLLPFESK